MRQRLVAGAADLVARRGLRATTVRELARHSGTPQGSTYHYFPGGKQQLATEAVRYNGTQVTAAIGPGFEDGPIEGVRAFCAAVRELMVSTDFHGGCPVLAVAVEGPDGDRIPPALGAAAEVLSGWEGVVSGSLVRRGIDKARAEQVATLVVAGLEGAVALCRAKQTVEPLDNVAAQLEALVAAIN